MENITLSVDVIKAALRSAFDAGWSGTPETVDGVISSLMDSLCKEAQINEEFIKSTPYKRNLYYKNSESQMSEWSSDMWKWIHDPYGR